MLLSRCPVEHTAAVRPRATARLDAATCVVATEGALPEALAPWAAPLPCWLLSRGRGQLAVHSTAGKVQGRSQRRPSNWGPSRCRLQVASKPGCCFCRGHKTGATGAAKPCHAKCHGWRRGAACTDPSTGQRCTTTTGTRLLSLPAARLRRSSGQSGWQSGAGQHGRCRLAGAAGICRR